MNEAENARKLARQIGLKVERQAKALEQSRAELAGVEAYVRDLENPDDTWRDATAKPTKK